MWYPFLNFRMSFTPLTFPKNGRECETTHVIQQIGKYASSSDGRRFILRLVQKTE